MNNKTQNTEPIIEVKDLMKSFGDNHNIVHQEVAIIYKIYVPHIAHKIVTPLLHCCKKYIFHEILF